MEASRHDEDLQVEQTYQRCLFNGRLGWHSNDVEWLDVPNKIETPRVGQESQESDNVAAHDYTRQLQFHEDQLKRAEEMRMPPAQVAYHFDRLCLLRKMGVSYE